MHLGPPIRPPVGPKPGDVAYRIYLFDGDGRSIVKSHEFFASDDEQAIKIAEGWREARKIELWERARLIKTWP